MHGGVVGETHAFLGQAEKAAFQGAVAVFVVEGLRGVSAWRNIFDDDGDSADGGLGYT